MTAPAATSGNGRAVVMGSLSARTNHGGNGEREGTAETNMHGLMMDYPLTLSTIFRRAETLYPGREVVTRLPDKTLHRSTYGRFADRARRLARALCGLGIKSGDRVATLGWNHSQHLEAYFGIPLAGAVLHTLNLRLHPDELAYIVNHAGDRAVLVEIGR